MPGPPERFRAGGGGLVNQQVYAPMVEVTRGPWVESAHRGAIAAVESGGRLIASLGATSQPYFVRSCAKPFQALALVCSGAADAFGVTDDELAVICASHSGEPEHVSRVASVLQKAKIDPRYLACGVHPPFDAKARRQLAADGREASELHNNCSGKHAGMLLTAKHLGLPLDNYVDPDHGVQIAIVGLLGFLCGLEPTEIDIGIDGCTAPTFQVPLRAFALGLARLAAQGEGIQSELPVQRDDEEEWDEDAPAQLPLWREEAEDGFPVPVRVGLARVWRAMKANPMLVAGTVGRLCTDLMNVARTFGVPLVAKSGAEGGYAIAVVAGGRAYGIALKVEDGAQRARDAAAIEALLQLELLPDEARGPLAGYYRQVVLNRRDEAVGEVRARFRLSRGLPG